jgi:hypothetical protein
LAAKCFSTSDFARPGMNRIKVGGQRCCNSVALRHVIYVCSM